MEAVYEWRQPAVLILVAKIIVVLFGLGSAATIIVILVVGKLNVAVSEVLLAAGLAGWSWLLDGMVVRPLIAAREDGVYVRNMRREVVIPWVDLAKIVPRRTGLRIYRLDGSSVLARAVQKGDLDSARGRRTRADSVVEQLVRLASNAGGLPGERILPTATEQRRLSLAARKAMIIGFAVLAVAIVIRVVVSG